MKKKIFFLKRKGAWCVPAPFPTEVPAPGPGHPSPTPTPPCHYLKTLELPGPVILGALFVLCLLLQPLQFLGQQLLVQLGRVAVSLGCLQGLSQPVGLDRRKNGTARRSKVGTQGWEQSAPAERNVSSLMFFRTSRAGDNQKQADF